MKFLNGLLGGVKKIAGVVKGYAVAAVVAVVGLAAAPVKAAGTDIVTYDAATGSVSWNFATILTNLLLGITAAIGAGVVIFIICYGWRLAKSFFKGK